ncbi:MAG: hypothetical protein IH831_09335 [Planctomycetes bacterium]|nr:hypothetical protein [Planctomycetota bacterium]
MTITRTETKWGSHFLESVYEHCMKIELRKRGHPSRFPTTRISILSILLSCQKLPSALRFACGFI